MTTWTLSPTLLLRPGRAQPLNKNKCSNVLLKPSISRSSLSSGPPLACNGCTKSGKPQQEQPVHRKPVEPQQEQRLVDRDPVSPEVQKRPGSQDLGNAMIEVFTGDPVLLASTLKNGHVLRGDEQGVAVFEKMKSKCIPGLAWSPR